VGLTCIYPFIAFELGKFHPVPSIELRDNETIPLGREVGVQEEVLFWWDIGELVVLDVEAARSWASSQATWSFLLRKYQGTPKKRARSATMMRVFRIREVIVW